jgi:hypothetical protein
MAADAAPSAAAPAAMSDDPSWWSRPALASSAMAESIEAGQVIGSATELVPDSRGYAAPAIDENGGLPVRVRQASLAPELREGNGAGGESFEATSASADTVRSTMSAMQRGWELGRSAAAESAGEPAGHDAGTPKHRASREEA